MVSWPSFVYLMTRKLNVLALNERMLQGQIFILCLPVAIWEIQQELSGKLVSSRIETEVLHTTIDSALVRYKNSCLLSDTKAYKLYQQIFLSKAEERFQTIKSLDLLIFFLVLKLFKQFHRIIHSFVGLIKQVNCRVLGKPCSAWR